MKRIPTSKSGGEKTQCQRPPTKDRRVWSEMYDDGRTINYGGRGRVSRKTIKTQLLASERQNLTSTMSVGH